MSQYRTGTVSVTNGSNVVTGDTAVFVGNVVAGDLFTRVNDGVSYQVASVYTTILTLGSITGGSSYTTGTYSAVALTGGSGIGATANITVAGGAVTAVTIVSAGQNYQVNDTLSASSSHLGGTGSGFSVPVATVNSANLTLNAPYGGVTATGASYTIARDFTPNLSLPYIQKGDIETATILKAQAMDLDQLAQLNMSVTSPISGQLIAYNGTEWVNATISGTTGEVTVSDSGDLTITLGTPQDIATTASPTWSSLTLTGTTASTSGVTGTLTVAGGIGSDGTVHGLSFISANVFSVVDQGATGNGTTNDATACQAAATAACGTTSGVDGIGTDGGILYFPQNAAGNATYLIESALTDSGYGVLAIVADPGVTITTNGGVQNQLINFTHCQSVMGFVRGGQWVCASNGGISLTNGSNDVQHWAFDNLDVFQKYSGGNAYGISVTNPILCSFRNVRLLYCTNGLTTVGGTSVSLNNVYPLQCVQVGIDINGTHYSTLEACAGDYNGVTYRVRGSALAVKFIGSGSESGTASNLTVTNSQISGSTCTVTYSGTDISSQFVTGMPVVVNVGTNTNCNGRWWVSSMTSNTIVFSLYNLTTGALLSPGNVNSADTGTISIYPGDGFQILNSYNISLDTCYGVTPAQSASVFFCSVNSQFTNINNCRGSTGSGTAQTYDIDVFHGNSSLGMQGTTISTSILQSSASTYTFNNTAIVTAGTTTTPVTAATSSANSSGVGSTYQSEYYSSGIQTDTWTAHPILGSGTTPSSTFTWAQSGATGNPGYTIKLGNSSFTGSFSIAQATAATSGNNYNSPTIQIESTYYNSGGSSTNNTWSFQDIIGTGTTPSTTYTISQSGSSGTAAIKLNVSTASTTTNTGALWTTGGVGVEGNVTASAVYDGATTSTQGNRVMTGITAGTGVTVSGSAPTGVTVAIGQSVATSATPTFAGLDLTGGLEFDSASSISAAGTTLSGATALTADTNVITTCAAGAGVALPSTAGIGREVTVINRGANALLVYPFNASGQIDGASAGSAVSVPVNGWITVDITATNQYFTIDPVMVGGTDISVTQSNNGTVTIASTGTISGTANEIAASSSTGAVVLSLPANVIIPTPSSGTALTVNAVANGGGLVVTQAASSTSYAVVVEGSSTTGDSLGLAITAGTNSTDAGLLVKNAANTTSYLTVFGDGRLVIGSTGTEGILVNGTQDSASTVYGVRSALTFGSAVTATGIVFSSAPSTSAASFTLTALQHYRVDAVTIGSGSAVTTQEGFFVASSMNNATNNYGYVGNLASATGSYNLYMGGTADNYLAGNLLLGSPTDSGGGQILQVTGSVSISGDVTSGTWQGTSIGATYGGTGQTAYATGDILYASATNTLSRLAAGMNGYVLTLVSGVPAWVTAGTATNATNLSGGSAGDIPYQTAASTTSFIAPGSNGQVLTMVSGTPAWAPGSSTDSVTYAWAGGV